MARIINKCRSDLAEGAVRISRCYWHKKTKIRQENEPKKHEGVWSDGVLFLDGKHCARGSCVRNRRSDQDGDGVLDPGVVPVRRGRGGERGNVFFANKVGRDDGVTFWGNPSDGLIQYRLMMAEGVEPEIRDV